MKPDTIFDMNKMFHRLCFLTLFIICACATRVCGQVQNPTTLEGWAQRLQAFGRSIPQEEVFVHMDNTCYYLGDTIYYKAYMRLSDGRPSPLSQLLYVELFNQDGYLVERQKVEMKQGQGNGSFVLLDTLYGGYYELRAYTRWQLNWGLFEHPHTKNAEKWFFSRKMAKDYYRDYEKLYSRVFPVYDKPREPGDYYRDMTMRPMRRVFKQKAEKAEAVVTFYPEGGNLVAGVPNRVAFEVNDNEGKHLKGELRVKDDIVARTENRGRGTFVVTPPSGERLKATFTWEGGSKEVSLPKAVADGVAMQARVEADGIHVSLQRTGTASTEPLGLTASCHGVLKDFVNLTDAPEANEILISQDRLTTGVIQLTVFNSEGRIYADRLVFVRQPDFQVQNISFTGLKPQYEPYEEVELSIATPSPALPSNGEGAVISLAVRDAAHSDYTFDSGNIVTEMLLASQIRGFVEQPEYFFEKDDEERRRALDLLLMVQGWRRYDWVTMAAPGAFSIAQPYEKTEILMGEVNRYKSVEQEDLFVDKMREYTATTTTDSDYQPEESPMESDMTNVEKEMSALQNEQLAMTDSRQGTQYRTNAQQVDDRFEEQPKSSGTLKREVIVHAEFQQPGVKVGESMVEGEMDTYDKGAFQIEAPRFYEACLFRYAAVDSAKFRGEKHVWIAPNEDSDGKLNYPDYYVKLNPIFPRFVKPYDFYQQNLPTARKKAGQRLYVDDQAILMDEVTIGARRSGMRKFDASKPAYVVDAYVAFNEACDAGLCPGYYIGQNRFVNDVARTYIGDMNLERAYAIERRLNTKNNIALSNVSEGLKNKYNHLPNLDMVYIYTDYSPRNEGDKRYEADNQPVVTIDLRRYEDDSQRMTYRDRFMLLTGYSVCEDFYQPDYSGQKPAEPTDYRRTLYWNPNLQLDAEGRTTVRFFNNSRSSQLTVSAEGMTATGQPLTGISYTEE